jgi:hypothetical protein
MVEVMITLLVMAISLGGFVCMVLGTQQTSLNMRSRDAVKAQGIKYMERLMRVPYGTAADLKATAPQVAEFFDDDAVVLDGAAVTLRSLQTPAGGPGLRFRVEGFEAHGVFEIEIDNDLDGNSTNRGIRGTEVPTTGAALGAGDGTSVVNLQSEGRPDLLRIEIFFNGESVIRALRAAPVEGT